MSATASGDWDSACWPYSDDRLDGERLIEEKAMLIDELDTDPEILNAQYKLQTDFSVGVFTVLMLIFWPFGIDCAYSKWRVRGSCVRH